MMDKTKLHLTDDGIDVPESDYDEYEHLADEEGVAVEEFVKDLDVLVDYSMASLTAREEFLSWGVDDESDWPSQDDVTTLRSRLFEVTSTAEYPYESVYPWLPELLETYEQSLETLAEMLEELGETRDIREESQSFDDAEMQADAERIESGLEELIRDTIESLQNLSRTVEIPEPAESE